MYYFDHHNKCHEEEGCVDISHFSVFSFGAWAIASEVIIGQNKHHHSIPNLELLYILTCFIWCIIKDIVGIYLILPHLQKNGVG